MCGIVAIFSRDKPIPPDAVTRATNQLVHRGPDEQHQWTAGHGLAALGHTRLSIIDLVTGAQPIKSEDERFHIVVNGEFYDFEHIRLELEGRGHCFRTRSDSEIALHLYEEMGAECLRRLRGEFAFVIWDDEKRTLFAARDRFGIKPLFYSVVGNTLYLASEIAALFAAGVPGGWDRESVFQNLFLSVDQDRTLYDGIRQVPPGHYLVAGSESTQIRQYWDVGFPRVSEKTIHHSESVCVEQLRQRLDEAVSLRMRADVPVGCYVSGGVDSSAVLGLASAHAGRDLSAFTVAFDHPDFDESAIARRSAERLGVNFCPVSLTNRDFADVFVEAVGHSEMVHYNAHGAARFLLSRAVQAMGYKVVLAGEGADELFAGYDFTSRALLSSTGKADRFKKLRMMFRLLRPRNQLEQQIACTSPWLARIFRVLAFPLHLEQYVAEKFILLGSMISSDFRREFQERDPYREFIRQFNVRADLMGREPARQILHLWMKSIFVNYVLAGERLDMSHGVEVRLPFLDHKLFEFARSIPANLLARHGRDKYVLREAVKPFVTREVYDGVKQPFFAPTSTRAAANPMYELMQDLMRSSAFGLLPFFDQPSVIRFLDSLPAMDDRTRASMDPVLFMMTSLTVLQSRHGL